MSRPSCCAIATMPDSIMSALCCPLTPTCNLLVPLYTATYHFIPNSVIMPTMLDHNRGAVASLASHAAQTS